MMGNIRYQEQYRQHDSSKHYPFVQQVSFLENRHQACPQQQQYHCINNGIYFCKYVHVKTQVNI